VLNSHYSSVINQSFLIYPDKNFTELVINPYKIDSNRNNLGLLDEKKSVITDTNAENEIFSIDSSIFDETSYLGNSEPIAYLSVNYNERLIKTFSLDTDLNHRLLYKYEINEDESTMIKSQCVSPLIRGEAAILIDDEIVLLSAESYERPQRLAKGLVTRSAAAASWQSIKFAGYLQPRGLLYSDPHQYYLIDSRIRNHSEKRDLWTFDLQLNWLVPNEVILQTS
jgi:hypothetical protein